MSAPRRDEETLSSFQCSIVYRAINVRRFFCTLIFDFAAVAFGAIMILLTFVAAELGGLLQVSVYIYIYSVYSG